MRNKVLAVIALVCVWALFRLYDLPARTFWGVEESFMYWGVKNVAVDHNITLIGRHFFSLVEGPLYRTPFYDWFMGISMWLIGFNITSFNHMFLLFSLSSFFFVFDLTRRMASFRAAVMAGIFWAVSMGIRQQEMMLWNVSLMISLTSFFLWYVFKAPLSTKRLFVSGLILGVGFSLHLVTLWLVAAVLFYILLTLKKSMIFAILAFLGGVIIDLSPLIFFNLRHNFIMRQGLINMFTGQNSGYSATITDRLLLVKNTMNILFSGLTPYGLLVPLLLVAGLVIFRKEKKQFVLFATTVLLVTVLGLFLSGRTNFGSLHYTLYLIPFIVITIAFYLERIWNSPWRVVAVLFLGIHIMVNINQWRKFQLSESYATKSALVNRILEDNRPRPINIKIMDVDVLAYDAIFYDALRAAGRPYSDVNLIEKWASDKEPDILIYSHEVISNIRGN